MGNTPITPDLTFFPVCTRDRTWAQRSTALRDIWFPQLRVFDVVCFQEVDTPWRLFLSDLFLGCGAGYALASATSVAKSKSGDGPEQITFYRRDTLRLVKLQAFSRASIAAFERISEVGDSNLICDSRPTSTDSPSLPSPCDCGYRATCPRPTSRL